MVLWALVLTALAGVGPGKDPSVSALQVSPETAVLNGSGALVQIVVSGTDARGRSIDLTHSARYESDHPERVAVDPEGLARPVSDGEATITVQAGGKEAQVHLQVEDFANTRPVWFAGEVVPIFTRIGCNNGGCHGKASGQNGFKLSLLGFDPQHDYDAIVREARGRRVLPGSPDGSLILLKPTARIPHGGGKRLAVGSPEYNTILRWLRQGMPATTPKPIHLVGIETIPNRRRMGQHERQQLRVVAHYDDGSTADVTRLAQFQSNAAELATVDEEGHVEALDGVGQAAIMARFGGQVAVLQATIPLGRAVPDWQPPAPTNLIDPLVFSKLRELGLPPSDDCTDAEFARRSSLDVCGILPAPEEVAAFEQNPDPQKRAKWIDGLLERSEYADFFAMKWSAILRNKRTIFNGQRIDPVTLAFHNWIRQSIAENKPFDQFAAEILAARGDPTANPPVAWYRVNAPGAQDIEEKVDDTAQLFLGMRIQCARCHHHPFEKWSQDDYYGFAAFFSRVGRKPGPDQVTSRIFTKASGQGRNPTSGKMYSPRPLGGDELGPLGPYQDPRDALADWLREPDNPFFARAIVNRYWKHFFGRGLVEPEDDMRTSNPPSNPELLDALAKDFIAHGYDLKHLVRTIATSRAYDRSSLPNAYNASDRQNFARYYPRRLPAEVLLDAIDAVTTSSERFNGLPAGFRATQLPDNSFNSYFLDVFGRPKRESVCECERSSEASLPQSLHLLNSGEIQQKLTGQASRVTSWLNSKRPDREVIAELYRLCYAREPGSEEMDVCLAHLSSRHLEGKLRQGYEDLLWTLINTKEFLLNH